MNNAGAECISNAANEENVAAKLVNNEKENLLERKLERKDKGMIGESKDTTKKARGHNELSENSSWSKVLLNKM